jgi:error-prone DNA polymerase
LARSRGRAPGYFELQVTTNYSFLRGASHPEELMAQARMMGHTALAVTDRNTLGGIARSHQRAREAELRLIVGCRLDLSDGVSALVYPENRPGWSRLCRLLTQAKRNGKERFELDWREFRAGSEGLLVALLADRPDEGLARRLAELREAVGDRGWLALSLRRRPDDAMRLRALADMAGAARVPTVAAGDVLYHVPQRRILQDVMTCIREGCTIDAAGFRRERSVDRCLKPPGEMMRLFERHRDAVEATAELAERARFSLDELCYQYPTEAGAGETAQEMLVRLCRAGMVARYEDGAPAEVVVQLEHELTLIGRLGYAAYFLTVHTIVREADRRGILCQGRGSAANSVVCYVLKITAIDPVASALLFERFISAERHEPPDIDVDFEHERREEMIQFVYDHYGRGRAALCATVMRFRSRGAVRDVGKVMGLTEDVTGALASQVWGWSEEGVNADHAAALNLNLEDRRLRLTLEIAKELIGFPRQLGTHPGGFVLTEDALADLVPIEPAAMENRSVVVWDKDDIDTLRWMKVDVLGLGMLGCMRRAFDLLAAHRGLVLDLASVPQEDPVTYAMITRADTLGTFQIESRAQMSMLPRMKPSTLYDLVIEVAVVRPGPIQGDMVHPYLRRREGLEPVTYPTPELERVLGKTLGIPLFQEQAMQVAIVCAGFTPGEADQLRRSMATFKMTGGVGGFREKMIGGMVERGYELAFAEKTFSQIEGFGSYGFPESHAASFALIAYASAWLKCHHPDVFCAALLNAQPMGFYAPAQIVRDAREHRVPVRSVSIQESFWDCTLEDAEGPWLAVRLGMRMAHGLSEAHAGEIVKARGAGPYRSIEEVWRRSGVPASALVCLANADAFAEFGLERRAALWAVEGLTDAALPLFVAADRACLPRPEVVEPAVTLPSMTEGGEVVADYRSVGLSLRKHPLSFLRAEFGARGMVRCSDLVATKDGRRVTVPGIVLIRQKPGSAKGVMFITIEDETGIANIIVWPSLFEKQRTLILSASTIGVRGQVQREGGVIHVIAETLIDLSDALRSVAERGSAEFTWPTGRGDEARHGGAPDQRQVKTVRPRDIYSPEFNSKTGIKVPTRDFR